MPRITGSGSYRFALPLLVVVLLFAFTPISRALLSMANGSFARSSYSSLALTVPADGASGYIIGKVVPVRLTNRTGHVKTYHWSATQAGSLISLGEETLGDGRSTTILVPTRGAVTGKLRIALTGTNIFVTVPIVKL